MQICKFILKMERLKNDSLDIDGLNDFNGLVNNPNKRV